MASRKDKKGRVLRKGETFRVTDNMYVYNYKDAMGKRRYVYSKDLVKLREKEKKLLRDQLDGIGLYAEGKGDLNFLFDRYIASKNDIRTTTKSNYITNYDRYVRNEFGKKKIQNIMHSDIVFFYAYLMDERNVHYGTVEYLQRVIRPTFQLAVRDQVIRLNPADGALRTLKQKVEPEKQIRHALTMEQQRVFVGYLESCPQYRRWKNLFLFLLGTGCRIGEAVGLTWDDVDFDKGEININHSMVYDGRSTNKNPCKWTINHPKTQAGIRIIPMVDKVREVLLDEKVRQEEEGLFCATEICGMSNFIFINRFQNIHNPQLVNRMLGTIIGRCNMDEEVRAVREKREPIQLPFFSCHILRHTFCTRLCEADVPVKVIQSVMGHVDVQTTLDIYAEVSETKKKNSLEEMNYGNKLF